MSTPSIVLQAPALSLSLMEQAAALANANQLILEGAHCGLLVDIDTTLVDDVRTWATQQRVDFAYFPHGLTNWQDIRILAMDMDSTLINIECIDEIAAMAGRKEQVAAITEAAMRGEIKDFSESLHRRVAMLEGVPASALEQVYLEKLAPNPGAELLLRKAHEAGIKTLLVSGGFTFFTERLQKRLGLYETHANTLEIDARGYLTGRVLGNIVDAQAKADYLADLATREKADATQCIAMGDGSNDLLMMEKAFYSVAYRAKPIVQQKARFSINYSGLNAVLNWFEGV
ncbi:phosphoserine phosphatase SerB [Pelistega europaea]|uniref:Phosphoserine phosphatase n=1 Tax=Pelistega europaea TaxID=106147 RepID=A0A7Y4LAX8_9BURK|nr:phosphoserine phosphatase SerB [Pelistega europaea]NOL50195.1 phosphoserine phosphatase SerB [Pelistega europaea]